MTVGLLAMTAVLCVSSDAAVHQEKMNRLEKSRSAYLRSAAHQPIHWYEWGEEAFAVAKTQDKPILLDIGAVWCHWCHVIDRESYENKEIAQLINELYVPVKVDVDARPDIDRRYQEVVQALTGQGGWPLTVFLTPEAQVITGGTYFPPEDRWGMPGMRSILPKVASSYRSHKEDISAQAKRLHQELAEHALASLKGGSLNPHVIEQLLINIENNFDEEHGGFGDAPKFPSPTALDLLLRRFVATGEKKHLSMVTKTLDGMMTGGMRDQLGGAFHRYSTDRFWRVPHFEVMLYVNAELMKIYASGYQVTRDPRYARVLEELIGYLTETLSDQVRGGFYGSQDADSSTDDDGDYWTWTRKEAAAVLEPAELEAVGRYYGIEEQGQMRENPAKNVLYEAVPIKSLAALLKKPEPDLRTILERASGKLLAARRKRKVPFVDQTIYANWNGLMVSGMLAASVAIENKEAEVFALKTLDRIWEQGRDSQGLLHVIQEGASHTRAFLDDYASLLVAFLDAYEVTQERKYLERAEVLAREMTVGFWDESHGGFFDIRKETEPGIEVLRQRRKPTQDAPTPSGNSLAALGLIRLFHITGTQEYRQHAERTLAFYAGTAQEYGLFAASFGSALDAFLEAPASVIVFGKESDPKARALAQAALSVYRPNRSIQWADPSSDRTHLPGPVKDLLKNVGKLNVATAFVCAGTQCAAPATTPAQVTQLVESFGLTKVARE